MNAAALLLWAVTAGYSPIHYVATPQFDYQYHPIEVELMIGVEFRGLYLKGKVGTYMDPPSGLSDPTFHPELSIYTVAIGYHIGILRAELSHECAHPTLSTLSPEYLLFGGRTEISLRLGGQIPIGENR